MNARRQAGFTLVELMIVVAIIAVLSAIMVGMASRPYEANAQVMSERLVSAFGLARARAVATRRVHRVRIYTATTGEQIVTIDAAATTGMAYNASTTTFESVEVIRIPKSAVVQTVVAGATTTTGASPSLNSSLDYKAYFKPDGSATASTAYLTDRNGTPRFYRVLVYPTTGSSYARKTW